MCLKTQKVVMKVTNDCNLSCKYCYIEKIVLRNRIISVDTVKRLFDELEIHSTMPKIWLRWHGGEPLLANIDFFREVVDFQKEYKKEYVNSIQTNGTLLSEEFARFFKENSFEIGLSLDGPKILNDSARVFSSGKGSFDKVVKKMLILNRLKVPFKVLSTISKINVKNAKDLYAFCKEHELPLKFSLLYLSGDARDNVDLLSVSPDEYSEFLIELTEIWMNDPSPIEIETLELYLGNVLEHGKHPTLCNFGTKCHEGFLAIGPSGDLYPCSPFQGYTEYRYGNIHEISLADIHYTPVWEKLEKRVDYINKVCSNCSIKEYCNGGCPFNAFAHYNTIERKDYFCNMYKTVIPALLEIVKKKIKETS